MNSDKLINVLDQKNRLNLSIDEEIGLIKNFNSYVSINHTSFLSISNGQTLSQSLIEYDSIKNKTKALITSKLLERIKDIAFERKDTLEDILFLDKAFMIALCEREKEIMNFGF